MGCGASQAKAAKSDPLPSDRPAPHEARENGDSGPSTNPSQAPFSLNNETKSLSLSDKINR